nr:hypothetical protein Iba_chr05eCG15000 [Ipomoea batatas]
MDTQLPYGSRSCLLPFSICMQIIRPLVVFHSQLLTVKGARFFCHISSRPAKFSLQSRSRPWSIFYRYG